MSTGIRLAATLSAATGGFTSSLAASQGALERFGSVAHRMENMSFGDKGTNNTTTAGKQLAATVAKLNSLYGESAARMDRLAVATERLAASSRNQAASMGKQEQSAASAAGGFSVIKAAIGSFLGTMLSKGWDASKGFLSGIFSQVEAINKLAYSLNIGTESIIAFGKLGKTVGVDTQAIEGSLTSLNQTLGAVSFGSRSAASAFELIGLEGKNLAAMPLDAAFATVADRVASISDPMRKAAAAASVFGDHAQAIIPLLEGIGKGVRNVGAATPSLDGVTASARSLEARLSLMGVSGVGSAEGLSKLSKSLLDASGSGEAAMRAFDRLSTISDPVQRSAAAVQAFGDRAGALAPAFQANNSALAVFADRASQAGTSAANLSAAQKRLADTVRAGIGPETNAGAALASLGLTAREIGRIGTADAMVKITNKISDVADPARKATAAFALFGDSARGLTPLLASAGKGLQEAADATKRTGEAFNRVDGEKIVQAKLSLQQLGDYLTGVGTQALTQISPWVKAFGDDLFDAGKDGQSMANMVGTAFASVAVAIGKAIDKCRDLLIFYKKIELGTMKASNLSSTGLAHGAVEWKRLLLGPAANFIFGKEDNSGMHKHINDQHEEAKAKFADMAAEITRLEAIPSSAGKIEDFFTKITEGAERAAREMRNIKTAGNGLEFLARYFEMIKQGRQIIGENVSPLEAFTERIDLLSRLLDVGALDWMNYARAAGKAFDELERSTGIGEVKRASALTVNTRESVDAINRYDAEQKFTTKREDPQERVRRVLEESKAIQERQAIALEALANVLRGKQQLVQGKF